MKRKLSLNPLISPVPNILVTTGDMEKSNIITIGWTGIICSVPPRVYISVQPSRYSYAILNETNEFVINLVPKNLIKAARYCGSHSGRDYDKFKETGLTKVKADKVACPLIEECPVNLECKVFETMDLGTHRMYMADVVAVHADEKYIGDNTLKLEDMELTCCIPNGKQGYVVKLD